MTDKRYRDRQALIAFAVCIVTGAILSVGAWVEGLPRDVSFLAIAICAYSGILFGMCAWYDSGHDDERGRRR